jgi:hypothetical protein
MKPWSGAVIGHSNNCFLNAMPLRTKLSGNPSFRVLFERLRDVPAVALSYEVPFEHLLRVTEETGIKVSAVALEESRSRSGHGFEPARWRPGTSRRTWSGRPPPGGTGLQLGRAR